MWVDNLATWVPCLPTLPVYTAYLATWVPCLPTLPVYTAYLATWQLGCLACLHCLLGAPRWGGWGAGGRKWLFSRLAFLPFAPIRKWATTWLPWAAGGAGWWRWQWCWWWEVWSFFLMGRHILILLCHKDSTSMRHFPFSTSRLYILGTLSGNGLDSGRVVCGDLGEIQRISLGKHRCCCKSSFMGVPNTLSGCWEKWSHWIWAAT